MPVEITSVSTRFLAAAPAAVLAATLGGCAMPGGAGPCASPAETCASPVDDRMAGAPDPDGGVASDGATEPLEPEAPVARRRFDPARVHLWGTLLEGFCGRDAVLALSRPDRAFLAFPCNVGRRALVRPTDGALLYYDTAALAVRRFGADRTIGRATRDAVDGYPEAALRNDPAVPLPACAIERGEDSFHVVPDTGELVFACGGAPNRLVDARGETRWTHDHDLVAVGRAGLLLTRRVEPGVLMIESPGGTPIALAEIPAGGLAWRAAVRAAPDGFLVATWDAAGDAPAVLWRASRGGATEPLGTCPLGSAHRDGPFVLDAEGALYGFAYASSTDVVLKYVAGAEQPELAYDEAEHPLVKIDASHLFSGP